MCVFCKGNTLRKSTTTYVVNYKNSIIVIKNVPCEECEQCGEKYLAIVNFVCLPEKEFEEKKEWYSCYKNIEMEGEVLYGR